MSRLHSRLLGLAGTVALVVFLLGTPALLIAIEAVPVPSDFAWSTMTARDDGSLALAVIGAVAWIAWAIFAVAVIVDIAARVRGVRAPRIPALVVPQLAAGRLVGVAALLFVAAPSLAVLPAAPRAFADGPAAPFAPAPPIVADVAAHGTPVPARAAAAEHPPVRTKSYTVMRGDSLWKIAKEHLGDGTRYVEIIALNQDQLNGEPDFLLPGTVLQVPFEPTKPGDSTYVVEPGDTLSEIAQTELGEATDYPAIFQASAGTLQPDGTHLTDPDLIRPGWRLTIPGRGANQLPDRPKHRHDLPPRDHESAIPPETTEQEPTANPPAEVSAVSPSSTNEHLPSWVLPGLAGGGAALAGTLLLVLRRHRHTQLRYRRPGRVIAPPPPELRPVQKSAHASGSVVAPRIEALDRALRNLGEAPTPHPRVLTASLSADEITLQLAEPTELDAPWTGANTTWTLRLGDVAPGGGGSAALYPLLVSLGMTDAGALVFVNLEELRSAVLTGVPERALALARHIAAELSLNPWSTLVEIDTIGIGGELTDIDPLRFHHHADGDTAFLDQLASDLECEDPAQEPDQYRALITTTAAAGGEAVRKVAKIITSYSGRAGAAVLTIGEERSPDDIDLHLTPTGRLTITPLTMNLTAAALTAEEAQACATLVNITREAADQPAPTAAGPTAGTDTAGALTSELTQPRPAAGPAGDRSLLPLAVRDYEVGAAATEEDLDALAPLASHDAEARVAEQDPELEEDLARWEAQAIAVPKLRLLGPVSARTPGDPKKIAHRRPYYVELLAFLVLHPGGVTALDLAQQLGIQPERARNDLSALRAWLGRDPVTGRPYLPNARQTHESGVPATYAVHDVLSDIDLFRRLRTRGQSRGAAGIDDLKTALSLVTGEPFSDLRPSGWGWLLEGDRLDHIMACSIVDTAHIVTTHGLALGDLDLARFSAETAYRAAPYDETSRLDLIAVANAAGDTADADRQLIEGVLNRSDDDLGPIDLPDRTAAIIRQRGWGERTARSAG